MQWVFRVKAAPSTPHPAATVKRPVQYAAHNSEKVFLYDRREKNKYKNSTNSGDGIRHSSLPEYHDVEVKAAQVVEDVMEVVRADEWW